MTDKCIRALVSGRVQGVYFRGSTRRQALQLNITGHATNLPDGRVEVVACGDSSHIEKLVSWLHRGPDYASVGSVDIEELEPQHFSGFSVS